MSALSQQAEVRVAARALAKAGFVHAYGHCSLRLDAEHFLVCAAKPMGLIQPGEPGTVVPIHGPLPEGVLGEVRIHQQIYQRRPEVNAVIRSMPMQVMSLSCAGLTPKLRHGMGAYFHAGVPLWDDPQLLRDDAQAAALAELLGRSQALVMRGNGAIVVGGSLVEVLTLNFYLEDAARIELQLLAAGVADHAPLLSHAEAQQRATNSGRIFERMWDYLTAGDAELNLITREER
ncbi:class II aldolase/adducin family protein [Pseudomonas sp. OVF7]|uniref:class II aldolase/adducin family protein n=1 Tax=unclassified Pseudomonas TaxID=196821 RepID=UPI00272B2C70|nr:class II aldolase/adducin family protein [Pseudomonas sp. OVF7]WLD65499.1 class II aldolase/adducin family protein [Pseudomonas sp. OVF7]